MIPAWRQVLQEGGGHIPDRNVERMLRDTHLPVRAWDNRRMDLVVSGLSVARGVALFCDVTVVSPITGRGAARSGASQVDGAMVRNARAQKQNTYPEIDETGLGKLFCLGVEVYGRWGEDSLKLVRDLARERCRTLPGAIARTSQAALLRRWWGLLSVSVQKAVSQSILRSAGPDLTETALEPPPGLADLPV
jgi:hypothetical protein